MRSMLSAVAVFALLVVAGCGDEDDGNDAAPAVTVTESTATDEADPEDSGGPG